MKKTTLYLPDELKEAISYKALSERKSEAEVIRHCLREATAEYSLVAPMPRIPDWEGDGTIASRVDELLAEGFGQH
ncbi:MAG TPA: CopG family transcriptional regulator [Chloroflexota bacterium]|nr:CopG family transcriptional regulator [Chloroflexota bacterium]